MAFTPWSEQVRGGRFSEDPGRDPPKNWWEKILQPEQPPQAQLAQSFAQEQARPVWQQALMGPSVAQTPQGFGQIMSGVAPFGMGGGSALPWSSIGQNVAGRLGTIPQWMARNKALTGVGGVGAAIVGSNWNSWFGGEGQPPGPMLGPEVPPGFAPPGSMPSPDAPPTGGLPQPGEGGPGDPYSIDVDGTKMIWDPTGNDGMGGWVFAPNQGRQYLTPEQELAEAERNRAFEREMAEMDRGRRTQDLGMQFNLEQRLQQGQGDIDRQRQAAGAAQQMANMYAADPYKYWAQMGTPTPEAVARLTGGEIAGGEAFQQGVPLSTPSAQWWGNLLPSEQQQISGGLNWLGIDPQDWMANYQRMIPGTGARQMGPAWQR